MISTESIRVISRPAVRLFGLFVRTDMNNALKDCPKLWEKDFAPRMSEISGRPCPEFQGESYGISIVVDMQKGIFDYWAAMAPQAGMALPQGMSEIEVPEGLYACCTISSLQDLRKAYDFLYEEWLPQQKDYSMNMQAPCFELYGKEYMQNGNLELFMPVVKK